MINYIICKRHIVTGVGYYFTVAREFDVIKLDKSHYRQWLLSYLYKNEPYISCVTSGKYGLHFTHNYIRYYLQEATK